MVLCMMCLGVGSDLHARTLYLNTGGQSLWGKDGASFFVHSWGGVAEADGKMSNVSGDVYSLDIPDDNTLVIFVRMPASASTLDWNSKWNQTDDLAIPADKNLYTITGWDAGQGVWSVYGSEGEDNGGNGGNDGGITLTDYDTAVPAECEDVMLQAFYWESQVNNGFGDTKWQTLYNNAAEISRYFSLVWLPPSSKPSGISKGLGYIADDYSNQSSNLGLKAYLQFLIRELHKNGTRVVADIVINHCGNYNNKCNFYQLNFGQYGSFSPNETWITGDDEGGCNPSGNKDDGQHEANYGAARDWDHKNTNVQAMCKAYLQWMRHEMEYDGFRFDYCGGYHVSHVADYVESAKPYFSVMEYWNGDANHLKQRIDDSRRQTLTFDFANMYTAFRDGIAKGNYNNCLNSGLRGKGYQKYAVTFVDNHDTFQRGNDNVTDICGKGDGSSINNQSVMLQTNAYILSLPGVPCVFYPHWVRYKTEIGKMINARRAAGIHSESSVQETAGSGYYEATVQGHRGQVILYLGSSASKAAPSGFMLAAKGSGYAMYYNTNSSAVVETQTAAQTLNHVEPIYNVLGQQVNSDYKGVVIQGGRKYIIE